MTRRRLFGVDPNGVNNLLREQQEQHRAALADLRERLAATQSRLNALRSRKADLQADLDRFAQQAQALLEELQVVGTEQDHPLRALTERHARELRDRTDGLRLVEQERDAWVQLERQVAEGVMSGVEAYLEVESRLHPAPESGGEAHD